MVVVIGAVALKSVIGVGQKIKSGFYYEDTIVISEGVVKDDVFTSMFEIIFYLIALGIGVFILVPVFIFFQGLYIHIRYGGDIALKEKGVHKMSLGLPTTVVFVTSLTGIFVSSVLLTGFLLDFYLSYKLLALVVILIAVATYITILFMRGARMWIKFRKDEENKKLKKWGRAKFIFAIYNIVAIVLLLMALLSSADFQSLFESGEPYNGGGFIL